jgi:hypothetical protein
VSLTIVLALLAAGAVLVYAGMKGQHLIPAFQATLGR